MAVLRIGVRVLVLVVVASVVTGFGSVEPRLDTNDGSSSSKGAAESPRLNMRPIIGILTQPNAKKLRDFGRDYLAASYVKYVESAGARVVAVPYNASDEVLAQYYDQINGLLLPGGASDISKGTPMWNAGYYFFQRSIVDHERGIDFPIWGTCQGFQMLMQYGANSDKILSTMGGENVEMPLVLNKALAESSRMLGGERNKRIREIVSTQPVTMNSHHYGVSVSDFLETSSLKHMFKILSINEGVGPKHVDFVSTVEAWDLPIYGTQWHPEKQMFEWADPTEHLSHTADTIEAMQHFARFFVGECRKNGNRFVDVEAEYRALIYAHQPRRTYHLMPDFQQCYFFDQGDYYP